MPKHPESHDWPWDPKLLAVFEGLGLTWHTLEPQTVISLAVLGSSPGDCYYTGSVFVFEYECPQAWVIHELAHWLVCRKLRPADLGEKNYGMEKAARSTFSVEEGIASTVTCGLERHLGIGDYKRTAADLNIGYEPLDTMIDEESAVYLEGVPHG